MIALGTEATPTAAKFKGICRRFDETTHLFKVIITGTGRKKIHTLKVVCGPGDDAEPVLTIMLPEED